MRLDAGSDVTRPPTGEWDGVRVAVVGAGSWGTTLASITSRNAPTILWARRRATVDEIRRDHANATYLPGFCLPTTLAATDSLEEAVVGADAVIMAVPSHG